ncbi:MAG: NADH-quinone oxidoreductase subunit L [Phycisphaerales bacterium]
MSIELIKLIPWIPLLGAALCGVCCMKPAWRKAAGPISALSIFIPFLITCGVYSAASGLTGAEKVQTVYSWIGVGGFQVNMGYFVDRLTMVMLFVVTGIGSLIATYAMGYMKGERGYARFFMGVSLFIFAMTTLVMADNLVLLYLGWEGVGLCSYLLIGYYYEKPEAVAAAKKAFIVNRIGDLGFALGIFLTYKTYGSVSLAEVTTEAAKRLTEGFDPTAADLWIPFLLMLGAFGKSAQIPLYVWLPDAMAGPTPVSALVHAATMVTAGVYMIARLIPVFQLSPAALPTVATIGGVTALLSGTIALCQYDLKKVFAYSTVSQLGYMFLGVGALSTFGGVFHLFTHAFFKALLFLTAGSVMHALAGQLDLRAMSGLRHKMPVTCWLMFVGCLALAGFPLTAGFFSKDTILAAAMTQGTGPHGSTLFLFLALMGLFTAFLTAFYTFRLWFRVFMGPEHFEMGDEHHGDDHGDAHGHGHDDHGHSGGHAHEPHEMPWWPMNAPLAALAIGAVLAGLVFGGWMERSIEGSTAKPVAVAHVESHAAAAPAYQIITVENAAEGHGTEAGAEHAAADSHDDEHHREHTIHIVMMFVSSIIALVGIALAAYFHWLNRPLTDKIATKFAAVVEVLYNKYYVDEFYDMVIVKPLRGFGHLFYLFDQFIINGLVMTVGHIPRLAGWVVRPTQSGKMQGYGLGMVLGVAVVALLVFRWAF